MKVVKRLLVLVVLLVFLPINSAYAQSTEVNYVSQTSSKYFSVYQDYTNKESIPSSILYQKVIGDTFYSGVFYRRDVYNIIINGVRYYRVNYSGTIPGYPKDSVMSIEKEFDY